MLICTLLNAGLDPLFIHFFGFNGAAAATVLSQILCLIFMMIYLYRKRLFHFRLSCFDKQLIPSFIKKRHSFCFSAEYTGSQHQFSYFPGNGIRHFSSCRLWNHREAGNHFILSCNGFEYGADKHRWTVYWRKKI